MENINHMNIQCINSSVANIALWSADYIGEIIYPSITPQTQHNTEIPIVIRITCAVEKGPNTTVPVVWVMSKQIIYVQSLTTRWFLPIICNTGVEWNDICCYDTYYSQIPR